MQSTYDLNVANMEMGYSPNGMISITEANMSNPMFETNPSFSMSYPNGMNNATIEPNMSGPINSTIGSCSTFQIENLPNEMNNKMPRPARSSIYQSNMDHFSNQLNFLSNRGHHHEDIVIDNLLASNIRLLSRNIKFFKLSISSDSYPVIHEVQILRFEIPQCEPAIYLSINGYFNGLLLSSKTDKILPTLYKFLAKSSYSVKPITCISEINEGEAIRIAVEKTYFNSSNDFIFDEDCNSERIALSFFVQILQIFCLILISFELLGEDVVPTNSLTLFCMRLLISIVVACTLMSGLSEGYDSLIGEISNKLSYGLYDNYWFSLILRTLLMILIPFYSFLGSVISVFYCNSEALLKTSAILLESVVFWVLLITTSIVTKQQSGAINSIYNFVGLILVSELDEYVAGALKYHQSTFHIETVNDHEESHDKVDFEDEKRIGKILASLFIVVGMMIYFFM